MLLILPFIWVAPQPITILNTQLEFMAFCLLPLLVEDTNQHSPISSWEELQGWNCLHQSELTSVIFLAVIWWQGQSIGLDT